jgi:hypothetical protein
LRKWLKEPKLGYERFNSSLRTTKFFPSVECFHGVPKRGSGLISESSQLLNYPNTERICDRFERPEGHTLKTALQSKNVGTVQTRAMGKLFLTPALLDPEFADPLSHGLLDILQLPQE